MMVLYLQFTGQKLWKKKD